MKPIQVSYTSVQDHKGSRIWLEGLKLETAGFVKDTQYRVFYDIDQRSIDLIVLPQEQCIDDTADRMKSRILTVSGRKKRNKDTITPIIDLCNADLLRVFGDATRVRADFYPGRITITIHHEEQNRIDRERMTREHIIEGTLTEGTFCAGIGVSTHALHKGLVQAGLQSRVEWIVDRERRYLQVAVDNNDAIDEDTAIFEASLEELQPELLGFVDMLSFSLPCTGHSISGKSKNKIAMAEEHERDATAVIGVLRAIHCINPSVLVSENVVEAQNSATYILLKAELKRLGYVVHELIMDEEDAGSFEARTRYWFVAVSEGLDSFDLTDLPKFNRNYHTLADFAEDIPIDDPMWSQNQYLKDKAVRDSEAKKGFAQRQLLDLTATKCGTIGRHYNKRRSTEPFVSAEGGLERLFTTHEHALAKGIPVHLVGDELATVAHEGLGQSILYNHGVLLGQRIGEGLQCLDMSSGKGDLATNAVFIEEELLPTIETAKGDGQFAMNF